MPFYVSSVLLIVSFCFASFPFLYFLPLRLQMCMLWNNVSYFGILFMNLEFFSISIINLGVVYGPRRRDQFAVSYFSRSVQ